MNDVLGMNAQQISALAAKMVGEAVALEWIVGPLTRELEAAPWVGPDRDRFVEQWRAQHLSPLSELIELLKDAGATARRHADEQFRASSS